MTRAARALFACRLLASASVGMLMSCGGDDEAAAFVHPVFGEPCRFSSCGDHGVCAADEGEEPSCLCEVGYAGTVCDVCESGFHRDHYGRCLTDTTCEDQAEDPCGENGGCLNDDGVISCECEEGYEGPRCTLCADRYRRDDLDRCLPLFITDQPGSTTCATGYTGPSCEDCAEGHHRDGEDCIVNETCDASRCPSNSICTIMNGKAVCSCFFGFVAPSCAQCEAGHVLDGNRCVPSETCAPDSCPPNASCVVVNGETTCQCFPEHTGPDCADCASGFHLEGSACVEDEVCDGTSCPAHATCDIADGQVLCTCEAGYVGMDCAQCDTGYHADGASCVPDETCSSTTCTEHATCVVVGGVARCDCVPGWDGDRCERCVDLATESTAFEFVTGWPTTVNNCATRPELSISRLTVRSRGNADYVQLCARSTYHALNTQHIALIAGDEPAELVFWRPVVLISFDYASVTDLLSLDVVVGDEIVDSIDLAPHFKDSLTLRLDEPSESIRLRSRSGQRQTISIDNIVYHYEDCP